MKKPIVYTCLICSKIYYKKGFKRHLNTKIHKFNSYYFIVKLITTKKRMMLKNNLSFD